MAAYFFVAADAGIVAADLCGQAGGELPAFLQGLASLICGAPALFPPLPAPTFGFEVFFGHRQQLGGDAPHHGAGVGGVFEQRIQAVVEPLVDDDAPLLTAKV